jgi:hypothetical protein
VNLAPGDVYEIIFHNQISNNALVITVHIHITFTYTELQFCLLLYTDMELSVTLRDEHRLTVFENGVLRKLVVPKRQKVIGDCLLLAITLR